jgi:D-alanine-D-alanine ligase
MKLAYLYTESALTPWKENVSLRTLNFLVENTPEEFSPSIVHFVDFSSDFAEALRSFDLVFNLCYGFHDAGQVDVADWLSQQGILHTASPTQAMLLAQDKAGLVEMCADLKVSTPPLIFSSTQLHEEQIYLRKPRLGSCHRGIQIESGAWFQERWNELHGDYILQPYISGREFSVAVIPSFDGMTFEPLPPVEIYPVQGQEVYTAGKSFGETRREFSPNISTDLSEALQAGALEIHQKMNLQGMSRTDFRVDAFDFIYALDVNAMPNLDPELSLMPAICHHSGISITELIQRIIQNTMGNASETACSLTANVDEFA